MYENPIYTYFSRYSKIYWFLVKNAYVNRTKGEGHVIFCFFWSFLGKINLCLVSAL